MLVLVISPSSELGIVHHFFVGFLILQGTLCQNLRIFLNWSTGWAINSTSSTRFFFRQSTGCQPIDSLLRLLANDSVFGIFGAFVQAGSSPGALDRFGE